MEYSKYFSSADFQVTLARLEAPSTPSIQAPQTRLSAAASQAHVSNQLDGGAWTELMTAKWFGASDPVTGEVPTTSPLPLDRTLPHPSPTPLPHPNPSYAPGAGRALGTHVHPRHDEEILQTRRHRHGQNLLPGRGGGRCCPCPSPLPLPLPWLSGVCCVGGIHVPLRMLYG